MIGSIDGSRFYRSCSDCSNSGEAIVIVAIDGCGREAVEAVVILAIDRSGTEAIEDVLTEMKKRHPKSEKLLINIAEVSLNNYDNDNALEIYKELVKINNNQPIYLLEISKIYQDKEKFPQAHKFAKKALKMNTSNEYAIFNFAEVLKNSVESCSNDELRLEDKVVYEISYKYYREAYKKGYKESKNMINWFKQNKKSVLPTLEDWFLIDSDKDELKPIEINPTVVTEIQIIKPPQYRSYLIFVTGTTGGARVK